MNDRTDSQLLRAYAEDHSEAAFAELVRRHVDFVHSAARRMVCDAHLAEDVTQAVFVALAKNSVPLMDRPVLSGWLHRTAQNIAAQTVRTDVRRRAREQEAATMNQRTAQASDASWEHIAPYLDVALGELREADRDALLLRYFERKSAQEMAQLLGISDEAAQRRVSRAVERLRELLAKRGVTTGGSGLVVLISAHAVLTAPAGLSAAILTTALAATPVTTTALTALTKAVTMTSLQKALIATALAASLGLGFHEARQAARLRAELQALTEVQAAQNTDAERQRDESTARLSALSNENERLKDNSAELMRLRAEVTRLRGAEQDLARLRASAARAANAPAGVGAEMSETELTRDSWADLGFATPQAALRTRGWSVVNTNLQRFAESVVITDATRKAFADRLARMAGTAADPVAAAAFLREAMTNRFLIEEGLLMRLRGENIGKGYTGYRIVSQQAPSPDETILEIETLMTSAAPRREVLKLQRFDHDWKVVVDSDSNLKRP